MPGAFSALEMGRPPFFPFAATLFVLLSALVQGMALMNQELLLVIS